MCLISKGRRPTAAHLGTLSAWKNHATVCSGFCRCGRCHQHFDNVHARALQWAGGFIIK